jgi:crotonobetainyl-CoA:carnitine CoA-transferase CaiB-like acyl-CoA transferase
MTETAPLSGIRVIEFTHTIMGPTAGLVLADLGADVVRVEPTPDGDRTRVLSGFAAGFHACFNRNKRSVLVDLKSDEGRAIARDIIASADVMIENFGPGTLDRIGYGCEAMRALNPRLIYCALKGFLPGPYEHRPALDEIVQFMAGLAYMTGPPGRPLRAGASVVDILGGVMGVVAILAALRARDADGQGRHVTASLYESAAFLVAQHMAGEAVSGAPVPPMPARLAAWGVYETFATTDGTPVFIGITSDAHWRTFCAGLARPDLLEDDRFISNNSRVAHREALRDIIAGIVAEHPIEGLCALFDRLGVPFAPVRRPSDLFDDPQLVAGWRMLKMRLPNGGMVNLPSLPIAIDGETPGLRLDPATPGRDTDAVLTALGYGAAEIAALRARGTVR